MKPFHTLMLPGLLVLIVLFGSACSVHKEMEPVSPPEEVDTSFSKVGEATVPDRWWQTFNDPALEQVIATALDDNLSLRQAWTRLEQARAVARSSGSLRWPTVEASGSAQRQRTGQPGFNPSTFSPAKTIDSFSASATASYQVDLWNKIDAAIQADLLAVSATKKDVEATAATIAASIADIWYSIAEQRAVLEVLQQQLEVNQEFLTLVELRFSQGQASALDVYQQRLQLASTRNQIPQAETAIAVLRHQLAVLLGKSPTADIPMPEAELPEIAGLPDTGVPADLLRNRPDIRAAELRIYAADRRVAAAIADKFPSLGLSLGGGARSNSISDFIDRWFLNIGGSIMATLFDGGRKDAALDQAEIGLRSSIIGWKQAFLTGVREVEDALVQETGSRRVYAGIKDQLELASQTVEQSRSRYVNGLSNYLTVLSSLQSLQNLERAEVTAYRQMLSNRINLYVALGGGWTSEIQEPQTSQISLSEEDKTNDE